MECYFTIVIVFIKCNICCLTCTFRDKFICNFCSTGILRINKRQISRIRYDLENIQKIYVICINEICCTVTCSRRLKVCYMKIELPDRIL